MEKEENKNLVIGVKIIFTFKNGKEDVLDFNNKEYGNHWLEYYINHDTHKSYFSGSNKYDHSGYIKLNLRLECTRKNLCEGG